MIGGLPELIVPKPKQIIKGTTYNTPLASLPTTKEELARCLSDPRWRVFSGCLYKIMIKGDDFVDPDTGLITEADTFVLPFKPNPAQIRFIDRLWHRNLILKARQMGFTTVIALIWLDHALWNADQRCGIIAHDREAAETIFRDKVRFAYENLPDEIRTRFPLRRDSAVELLFKHNNSSIRVATSMRSGTIHRLHISEFGKICAKYPDKAAEVITGSIPAVPTNGILAIESTAEGREGEFFEITQKSQAQHAQKVKLSPKDYRFHFYAWWQEPKYRLEAYSVNVTLEDHEYFDTVQDRVSEDMGIQVVLDHEQRAWYVATRDADFQGKEERMWQEYPSFPDEAFQVSTEGNYYAKDMLQLRKRGGITKVAVLDVPVHTFWDIGNHDGCAVWFYQDYGGQDRFIGYYEAHGEDLRHYVKELESKGYVYGVHHLPHDAAHQRLGDYNKSIRDQLSALMQGQRFAIIPRITELINGIQQTRKHMKNAWIDESACKLGISRLDGYRKKFNRSEMRFIDLPDKANGCSEGADAFRQWAQAKELGLIGTYSNKQNYQEAPPTDWRLA